jgi:hypothetical protein
MFLLAKNTRRLIIKLGQTKEPMEWYDRFTQTLDFEYVVFGQQFIEAFSVSNEISFRVPDQEGKNAVRGKNKLIRMEDWEPVFIDPASEWVYWLHLSISQFLLPDTPCELCNKPINPEPCWTQTSYKRMLSLGGFWMWIGCHGKTRHGHKGCLLQSRLDK